MNDFFYFVILLLQYSWSLAHNTCIYPTLKASFYICRLEDYNRNHNFGYEEEDTAVYKMEVPPLDQFKDLNTAAVVSRPKFVQYGLYYI